MASQRTVRKVGGGPALDVPDEEPRVGVFVCHCGTNIGGIVDVPAVVEYVAGLPYVVHAERNLYTCAEDGITSIKAKIKEHGLNRVIVASCTPRTHAPLFMSACEDAGLNPYLFEFVNIRDQCSWVHMGEKALATEKAKDLIRMGVAKAARLLPLERFMTSMEPSTMVIGGGVAGLTAAECIANSGFEVYLVEREGELGGMARHLSRIYPSDKTPEEVLGPLVRSVRSNRNIHVITGARVKEVLGYVGNFDVTVSPTADGAAGSGPERFKVGAIIVATGAEELKPRGLFGYGEHPGVITLLELEERLREDGTGAMARARNIVMVQCAGARGQGPVTYCSRICCMTAVKNALLLKEADPERSVTVLYRDIECYGVSYESLYNRAKDAGVRFVAYPASQPPVVGPAAGAGEGGALRVSFFDRVLGRPAERDADLVVLSTPLVQHDDGAALAKILRVPLGLERFFFEAHVKLRPVDFATDGIFLCGSAQGPKDITESTGQALGAAVRCLALLRTGQVVSEPIVSRIDKELCIGCGGCLSVCPYGAIAMVKGEGGALRSDSNALLCKGCGVCAVTCPAKAITMQGYTDDQMLSQVSAATERAPSGGPLIVGFCCNWCSYAGADMAGVSRFQYPPNIRIIRVMCSGRVDPKYILWALLNGADGVFVSGCHPADCHYVSGNKHAEERIRSLKEELASVGFDPRRVRLEWISASEGRRFADLVAQFTKEIEGLGPSPVQRPRESATNA